MKIKKGIPLNKFYHNDIKNINLDVFNDYETKNILFNFYKKGAEI